MWMLNIINSTMRQADRDWNRYRDRSRNKEAEVDSDNDSSEFLSKRPPELETASIDGLLCSSSLGW